MSSGKKPKKAKVHTVDSQYKGVNSAEFSSDFGTGFSAKTPTAFDSKGNPTEYSLTTDSRLADFLQPIPEQASQGIQGNLDYLQLTPQEMTQQALGGENALFNVLNDQTESERDKSLARALVNSQGTGTSNSTTAGAAQGTVLKDYLKQYNQNLLNSFQFQNENARANLGANLSALGGLANLVYPLGSAANQNLLTAFNANDQTNLANAQAKNQAEMQYAQAVNQARQNSGLGGAIGSVAGAALGLGLAPFTGGSSLMLAGMGAGLGGGIGNAVSGGGYGSLANSLSNVGPFTTNYGLGSFGLNNAMLNNTGGSFLNFTPNVGGVAIA